MSIEGELLVDCVGIVDKICMADVLIKANLLSEKAKGLVQ